MCLLSTATAFPEDAYLEVTQVGSNVLDRAAVLGLDLLQLRLRSGHEENLVRGAEQNLGDGKTQASAGSSHDECFLGHDEVCKGFLSQIEYLDQGGNIQVRRRSALGQKYIA